MTTPPRPDLIDLSHALRNGLVTYPGLPGPRITDHLSFEDSRGHYAEGTSFHIGKIEMVANTGTYLDAPSHRYADGPDLAALPLEHLADLPGIVVDLPAAEKTLTREALETALRGSDVCGRAVLVRTGWSRHFGSAAYAHDHPHVSGQAAQALRDGGATLVGIDSLNIDDTSGGERPVHSTLLAAGIPVVEHLVRLEALPRNGFRFFAVPVKIEGMGTFPVRAFAIVDG